MSSINAREEITACYDALEAAVDAVVDLDCTALTTPERLALLERLETVHRRLPAVGHGLINAVKADATSAEIGGNLAFALAERCRIARREAGRRIHEAADLGPRHALTGEQLEPLLAATAAAQRAGRIGAGHVTVIRDFLRQLPSHVTADQRAKAEQELAHFATRFRPDQLIRIAQRMFDLLNQDGNFTDEDRARSRGVTLSRQQADGMSRLTGYINPELRATLEAVLAKLAAPGMCDPDQTPPTVDGPPPTDAIEADHRSTPQRNHDALLAALRSLLACGTLGQHNGLPASIIVTTTLTDLETGAARALTGGGTLLPMSDVIRLARHAHHYLAIFDRGKTIGLFHTKRLASPGQRIVLYAKDRGCSYPGCDVPGYLCEVHHVEDYAKNPQTDIDELTFACGPHHRLITPTGWRTRKNRAGDTEWIPPPHTTRATPGTNTFHHPEKLLHGNDHATDHAGDHANAPEKKPGDDREDDPA